MSVNSMFDLSADYERLLQIAELGADPVTGEVYEPEDIDKAFTEIKGEAEDKISSTAYVLQRLKADANVLDEEIKRLKAKRDSILAGRERLQDRLREFMATAEVHKVKTPSISVSLGKPSERCEITDETAVPDDYARVVRQVEKQQVKDALKKGQDVPGAQLVNGPNRLTIR